MGNFHSAAQDFSDCDQHRSPGNEQSNLASIGLANGNTESRPNGNDLSGPARMATYLKTFKRKHSRRPASQREQETLEGPGEATDVEPSAVSIRKQQLQHLQQQRPRLTTEQMEVLHESWGVLQRHTEEVGRDMFVR